MTLSALQSTELDPLRAAGSLARLVRLLDQRVRAQGGPDGLGVADLSVLGEIGRGTALPSVIARDARLDPARVTRIVERLVGLGLVVRGASAHDRRQSPLALTARGEARLEQGRAEVRAAMGALLDRFAPEERAALATALRGVQRALSEVPG